MQPFSATTVGMYHCHNGESEHLPVVLTEQRRDVSMTFGDVDHLERRLGILEENDLVPEIKIADARQKFRTRLPQASPAKHSPTAIS